MTKPTTISIGSAPMFFTPGLARYTARMFRTDQINAFVMATGLVGDGPAWGIWGIVLGAYIVAGDAIVIEKAHVERARDAYAKVRRAQSAYDDACDADDRAWKTEARTALREAARALDAETSH